VPTIDQIGGARYPQRYISRANTVRPERSQDAAEGSGERLDYRGSADLMRFPAGPRMVRRLTLAISEWKEPEPSLVLSEKG
jgi:hypothetical protein